MYTNFTDWESGLRHHGVKGQKWGKRQYQNFDGTLTEIGKKHYGYSSSNNRKAQKQFYKTVKKTYRNAEKNIKKHGYSRDEDSGVYKVGQLADKEALNRATDFSYKNNPIIRRRDAAEQYYSRRYEDTGKLPSKREMERFDRLHRRATKSTEDWEALRRSEVDRALGKYGKKKIDRESSFYKTAGDIYGYGLSLVSAAEVRRRREEKRKGR